MVDRTVAVTGGNGTVGRAVLKDLRERGYRTVNLNRGKRSESIADEYLTADLLDAGEVYGSLARSNADAVVHLGMIPTPNRTPGHVTFGSNAMSTYHVLEAASALDIDAVAIASSLSALGAGFEPDPVSVEYLPLDEGHPLSPSNPYGLGKQVIEVTADGFARRDGAPETISTIRYPWVTTDDELRSAFVEADRSIEGIRESGHFHTARNTLFSYVHAEDAAEIARLAVEADFRGHERFLAAAADTTAAEPSAALAEAVYGLEPRSQLEGFESLVDTEKAARVLGWAPKRTWREL